MKQNQKGITLVALAITIIVILVIAGTAIYTGRDIIKSANLQNISTNLLLVQAKIKTISEKADFEQNEDGFVGDALTDEIASQIGFDGNKQKARLLNQEHLNQLGLNKIDADKGYVVDYENEEVYFVAGYRAKDDKVYYQLSAITNLDIDG